MKKNLHKIFFLIQKKDKRKLIVLYFLILFGAFLEIFGIGIIFPAISIVLDPDNSNNIYFLNYLKTFFLNISNLSFTTIFLVFVFIVYVFKTLFLIYLSYKQNYFINTIVASVSNRLLKTYLSQPYLFHLNRNSSDLVKNLQTEMRYLHSFLQANISVIVEASLTLSVLFTTIYIEPIGTIVVGLIFGLMSLSFFQFIKNILEKWGQKREILDKNILTLAYESLGGIKEIKILNSTKFFISKYFDLNYKKAGISANYGTLSQVSRYFLELTTISGLIVFLLIMIASGSKTVELLSTIGVFVVASFRMIPSVNKILISLQNIKFHKPSLEVIYQELKQLNFDNEESLIQKENFEFRRNIIFNDVCFGYGKSEIISNINFEILKGQKILFIGESGSGKSTIIDLLIGLHKPYKGEILIDNYKLNKLSRIWMNKIGYVSQTTFLIDDSIKNNICLGLKDNMINLKRLKEIVKKVRLEKFISSLEHGINENVGERGSKLSGGQRQRIGIARALYHKKQILILDEPTSSLDNETGMEILKMLINIQEKKTIIMISHNESLKRYFDIVYKVDGGKILKV